MSAKSMFKQLTKGTPKKEKPSPPRSKEEINKSYTQLVQQIGSKTVEAKAIEGQLNQMFRAVESLSQEMNARIKLEAEEMPKAATAPNPEPQGEANDTK